VSPRSRVLAVTGAAGQPFRQTRRDVALAPADDALLDPAAAGAAERLPVGSAGPGDVQPAAGGALVGVVDPACAGVAARVFGRGEVARPVLSADRADPGRRVPASPAVRLGKGAEHDGGPPPAAGAFVMAERIGTPARMAQGPTL